MLPSLSFHRANATFTPPDFVVLTASDGGPEFRLGDVGGYCFSATTRPLAFMKTW
jgi:hypothetical protein